MKRTWLLTMTGILVVAGAAWFLLRSPVPDLDEAGAARLSEGAEQLWERYGRGEEAAVTIPVVDWPPEIHRLKPETATADRDGVYIKLGSFYVEAWGVFVLPKGSSFQPIEGGDPSYRRLQDQVYWYEIKG